MERSERTWGEGRGRQIALLRMTSFLDVPKGISRSRFMKKYKSAVKGHFGFRKPDRQIDENLKST